MTTANQGRNEIRFNNSQGKCLLENWVEERAVEGIDPTATDEGPKASAQVYKDGHKGLLSTQFTAPAENLTTIRDSYRPPQGPGVRLKGAKQEMLEKMIYDQVNKEVHAEFNAPPEIAEYKSVTKADYTIEDFTPSKPAPTAAHDYVSDQPVTFWSEHKEKIHGKSQEKNFDSAFRKNTAFSRPIEEHWNQPKPHELDNIPMM